MKDQDSVVEKLKYNIIKYDLHFIFFIGFFVIISIASGGDALCDIVGWFSNTEVIYRKESMNYRALDTTYYFFTNEGEKTYFFLAFFAVITSLICCIFYTFLFLYKYFYEKMKIRYQTLICVVVMFVFLIALKFDSSKTFLSIITLN